MEAAGAGAADSHAAATLLQQLVGRGEVSGWQLRIAVGRGSNAGATTIEEAALSSELGTITIARTANGAFASVGEGHVQRYRGRFDGEHYWSLRRAGLSSEAALQAQKVIEDHTVPTHGAFDIVVAEREAGLGAEKHEELQALRVVAAAQAVRLVRWRDAQGSRWLDIDKLPRSTGLARPSDGRVTSTFGRRMHPILRFTRLHAGVDFEAKWGDPVRASADGQIEAAHWRGGYGRQVRVVHGRGLETSYSHLSDYAVVPGQQVRRGDIIGFAGASGLATGTHLHYEVRRFGQAVDPATMGLGSLAAGATHERRHILERFAKLLRAAPASA